MQRLSTILLLLLLAGSVLADVAPARQQALLYMLRQDCGSCHGLTLKGGLGPPLLPQALSVRSEDELVRTVLDGRPGTPMPPWRPFLSEEEVRWLVRWLRHAGEGAAP